MEKRLLPVRLIIVIVGLLIISMVTGCAKKQTEELKAQAALIAELTAKLEAAEAALAAMEAEVSSQPMQKSETTFPVLGKWKITGTSHNGSHTYRAYMTISDITGTEFSAVIDWHDPAGSVAVENVKGAYNPQNRQITLTRGYGAKIDVDVFKGLFDNIEGKTFTAYLSENDIDFINGKWMNDGEWEAHWPENGVDFPDEYNPPMDFRPGWAYEDF